MKPPSAQLRSNPWLRLDYILGLRGFGLIVYGALPASLGALGAFKPPDQAMLSTKLVFTAIPYVIAVAVVPVVITFVLVRQRLAQWYLLRNYLFWRAAVITGAIILVSAIVSGANGLLLGTYYFPGLAAWQAFSFAEKVRPVIECLLLSFAYLVGSSTLFLTVIKEDSNLPLLPGQKEVVNLGTLRTHLRELFVSPVQTAPAKANTQALTTLITAFNQTVTSAGDTVKALELGFSRYGRKQFYKELCEEFTALETAANEVNQSYVFWHYYWDPDFPLKDLNEVQVTRRTRIQELRGLCDNA